MSVIPKIEPGNLNEVGSVLKSNQPGYLRTDQSNIRTAPDIHLIKEQPSFFEKLYYHVALWYRETFMLDKNGKDQAGTAGVKNCPYNEIIYSTDENSNLAAYLMQHEGMTLEQAIERVQRDRPDAQLIKNGKNTKHTNALVRWALKNEKPIGNPELLRQCLEQTFDTSEQWTFGLRARKASKEAAKADFEMMKQAVFQQSRQDWEYLSQQLGDEKLNKMGLSWALNDPEASNPIRSENNLSPTENEFLQALGQETLPLDFVDQFKKVFPGRLYSKDNDKIVERLLAGKNLGKISESLNRLRKSTGYAQTIFQQFFRGLNDDQMLSFNAYLHSLSSEEGSIITAGRPEQSKKLLAHNKIINQLSKSFLQSIPSKESESKISLALIASKEQATTKFEEMLTAKTEQEAMALVSKIVVGFEDEDIQKISDLCTRIIQRRFCAHRAFHDGTVGTGLAGIPAHGGYGKNEFEGRGWNDPGWPAMWQHASWKQDSTLTKATRVLGLHDSITNTTVMGEVKLDLSEFGQLSEEQQTLIMKAIAKGAKEISERRPLKTGIEGVLGKEIIKQHSRLSHVLETFVRACDLKITELNQKLQGKGASQ